MGHDVLTTVRNFELLEAAKIDFNYRLAGQLYKPLMEGTFSTEQAVAQCKLLKKPKAAAANAGLISAFGAYASDKKVAWFNNYTPDVYPIAAGVAIPLNPPGFWADGGQLKLLWVQPWKGRTLSPRQRAIFYTILSQRIFIGEDFSSAELEWVDLRAPRPKAERSIEVLSRKHFDLLTEAELKAQLDILLEAFNQFSARRDRRKEEDRASKPPPEAPLFDR
jgi:hypothetical protein